MADIKKIKIGNNTYDIRDNRVITLTDGGSKTAGTWVANTGSPTQNLTAYSDGQLFLYKVTVAGASTTTLNIDGLGAKTIYRGGTTKLTTQYGVGSYVLLYYSSSLNSGSFIVANDSDANSDNDKKTSSGDTSSKIYLVGATTRSTSGQTTYTHDTVYVDTDGHLYDSGDQVEIKGHGHDNATASTDGFMSAADKTHHDKMWNAWSADGTDETLVNKVEEVLTVFTNFPEADNLVEVLSGKSNVGHTHEVSKANAAPSGHTHTLTVSGTTGANNGSAVKAVTGYASFSGGSGKLEAYDAATGGTKKVSNGTRVPVVTSVTHSQASLTGDTTFVKTQGTFSAGTTPVSSAAFVGTEVTSGANSGTAVTALTGVKASSTDTFVKNISAGSGSLELYANSTTTTAETKTDGRIPVVTSILSTKASASGTAKAGSETHTHNYDKTTGVSLTANAETATGRIKYVESISGGSGSLTTDTTSTNGIKYVESISSTGASASGTAKAGSETHTHTYDKANLSGSNSSHTVKYMKFSAGTTPKSGATPVHTSTNSGADNGTAITALTGVKVTAQPTIGLTANAATATGRITYVESISGGSGSLTSDTTSTNGIKYVEAQGTFSAGTTPPKSASFSGTAATITPTVTLTGSLSGTCLTLSTSVTGASYTPAGSVTLTAGTAPSMGAATTKYLHHTHTAASATTKYLSASASGTAVGANGTASVAPSGHTHAYDKTTSITLTAGTAPSINFDTKTNTDTPYVASATNSSLSLSHTSTASGAPSATTSFVTGVTGGTASATTKYLHHSHSGASATTKYLSAAPSNTSTASAGPSATTTFVTGVSGGTTTATTKYLEHTHIASSVSSSAKAVTAVAANGTANVAPSSHTHTVTAAGTIELTRGTAPSLGAATTGTVGISGGSITPTTYYLEHGHTAASLGTASTANAAPHTHTHSYGSSTALTTGTNSGTAVAAVTEVKASTN